MLAVHKLVLCRSVAVADMSRSISILCNKYRKPQVVPEYSALAPLIEPHAHLPEIGVTVEGYRFYLDNNILLYWVLCI